VLKESSVVLNAVSSWSEELLKRWSIASRRATEFFISVWLFRILALVNFSQSSGKAALWYSANSEERSHAYFPVAELRTVSRKRLTLAVVSSWVQAESM
jgi:hypothetical protein